MAGPLTRFQIIRARNAVAVVFTLAGLVIASWLSRIPQVRDHLELTPGQLGRVLLALAAGSVIALPTAGLVVNRIGASRAVAGGTLVAGAGLLVIGLGGGPLASPATVAAGLFVVGYGAGTWDVSMNVEGAAIERWLERSIMPRLHAGFSLGTVAGAGLGAAAAALQVPVAWHLSAVGVLVVAVGVPATRWFLPAQPPAGQPGAVPAGQPGAVPAGQPGAAPAGQPGGVPTGQPGEAPAGQPAGAAGPPAGRRRASVWTAWREPRTLLVGVLVLAFALSEGIAYDWLAVGLVDGLGVTNALGAIALAVFVTAMTVGRTVGTAAIDRFGRVRVLRVSAGLAVTGVLLVVFGGSLPVALAGTLIWGVGTALGFPIGMSAGADDPQRAAIRVSVVASIAYTAFLAGPPLLGALGDQLGVQRALLVAAAAMVVGALVAGATRPLPPAAGASAGTAYPERISASHSR